MAAGRHRKTVPARVRLQRLTLPAVAALAAATVVPVTTIANPSTRTVASSADSPQQRKATHERAYTRAVSRSAPRTEIDAPVRSEIDELAPAVLPDASTLPARWATVVLNVWRGAGEDTKLLTELDDGAKVRVTGDVDGRWAQILRGDRLVWVRKIYLAKKKPVAGTDAPVSGAPCPDGSSVESGLTSNATKVYRSVCAAFPGVTAWGGWSGGGDHGSGQALDIMVTGSMGDAIAAYVRSRAGELGVSYVIWSQRIWTVERGGEGWRYMTDRGSTTANHYDHVHVSVF